MYGTGSQTRTAIRYGYIFRHCAKSWNRRSELTRSGRKLERGILCHEKIVPKGSILTDNEPFSINILHGFNPVFQHISKQYYDGCG